LEFTYRQSGQLEFEQEMTLYLVVKVLHVLSATVLFGTGLGIAFFMFRSTFTTNKYKKLFAAENTVLADTFFTLPAVILQPLTGAWLVHNSGFNWNDRWLVATYLLYILAGLCWLPVVWIQIRLKRIIQQSIDRDVELPGHYHSLFKFWFILGWPAFCALVLVFFLMVFKPV